MTEPAPPYPQPLLAVQARAMAVASMVLGWVGVGVLSLFVALATWAVAQDPS